MKNTLVRQVERIEQQPDIRSKAFARWLLEDEADEGILNLATVMAAWGVLVDPGPQVNAIVDKWIEAEGQPSDEEFKESGAAFTYTAILWQVYDQVPARFRLPDSEINLLALSLETLVEFGGMNHKDVTPDRCRFLADFIERDSTPTATDVATDEECRAMNARLKEALQSRIAAEVN